jgi:hypothetical protein
MSRNSKTPARASVLSTSYVCTIMPSAAGVEHDVCSLGIFSIYTRQTRHDASMTSHG